MDYAGINVLLVLFALFMLRRVYDAYTIKRELWIDRCNILTRRRDRKRYHGREVRGLFHNH